MRPDPTLPLVPRRAIPLAASLLTVLASCRIDTEPGSPPPASTDVQVTQSPFPACDAEAPSWTTTWLPSEPLDEHRFAGGGVAVEDLDGDGAYDLLLADASGPRVLLGPAFEEAMPTPVPNGPLDAFTGIAVADMEGDGDIDVWWVRFGAPDVFWRNDDGAMVEAPTGQEGGDHHGQSAAWADLDGDGWLDLVVAGHGAVGVQGDQVLIDEPGDPTRILRGGPDGLTPWPGRVSGDSFDDAYSFVIGPVDLDGDGRLDLFAANDYPAWLPQQTLWNEPDGFRLDDGGTGLQPQAAGMGLGLADVDLDGAVDLLLPVWDRVLFLESVDSGWVETAQARGLRLGPRADRGGAWVGWGAELVDLDVDGAVDALVAFGHLDTLADLTFGGADASNAQRQGLRTWRSEAGADGAVERFVRAELGLDTGHGTDDGHAAAHRGLVATDLDGDGVLDVVAPDLDGGVVVKRSSCTARPSITVAVKQAGPNRDAVGATVVALQDGMVLARGAVRRGGTGLLSSGPATVHLGLPAGTTAVDLEVRWPDGDTDRVADVPTRHHVDLTRPGETRG